MQIPKYNKIYETGNASIYPLYRASIKPAVSLFR
jgi:hypothetical protein